MFSVAGIDSRKESRTDICKNRTLIKNQLLSKPFCGDSNKVLILSF